MRYIGGGGNEIGDIIEDVRPIWIRERERDWNALIKGIW
jgi:hypothetical protein